MSEKPMHPTTHERKPDAWVPVEERKPSPGVPVLVYVEDGDYSRRLRAEWSDGKSLECHYEETEHAIYDEERDVFLCPEGWYESNENEEVHWMICDRPVTHWMPLPPPPGATAPPGPCVCGVREAVEKSLAKATVLAITGSKSSRPERLARSYALQWVLSLLDAAPPCPVAERAREALHDVRMRGSAVYDDDHQVAMLRCILGEGAEG